MNITTQNNTSIIQFSPISIDEILEQITAEITNLTQQNTIVDLSENQLVSAKNISGFLKIAQAYKKAKKSFVVVVASDFDFNHASDKINIVPSLQEAHDIIEMEEIERDLGF